MTVPVQSAYPANIIVTAKCPGGSFVENSVRLNGIPANETIAPLGTETNCTCTSSLLDTGAVGAAMAGASDCGCCVTCGGFAATFRIRLVSITKITNRV